MQVFITFTLSSTKCLLLLTTSQTESFTYKDTKSLAFQNSTFQFDIIGQLEDLSNRILLF